MITNDAEIEYQLHLFAEGLVDDGTQCPSSTLQDRLSRLIDLCSSWRTFSWKRIAEFTTDERPSGEQPKLRKGGFTWITKDKVPLVYRLPTRDEPEKLTRCDGLENFNVSFCTDPEQNLMVLFNIRESFEGPYARMVIRTLSNETHPDAQMPFLECCIDDDRAVDDWANDSNYVQVLDDVLAYWTHVYRRLVLWNWKTGVMFPVRFYADSSVRFSPHTLTNIDICQDYYFGDDDLAIRARRTPRFAFLTPLLFIILNHDGSGSLDVYSVEDAASSNVLQFDSSSDDPLRDPVHIASFALPTINSELRVKNIHITGNPASSQSSRRVSSSPFALAPDGHIYLLDLV